MQTLMDIKEDVGGIKKDVTTLKEHTSALTEAVTRIESKHNQDYLQYSQSREELHQRIVPLEEDYKQRKERKDNVEKKFTDFAFDLVLKGLQYVIIAGLSALAAIKLWK